MTHDIKQLSLQSLKALLALREDYAKDMAHELSDVMTEISNIRDEINRREIE